MKNLNEFIGTFSNANKFHGIDFQPEENDSEKIIEVDLIRKYDTQESKSFIYSIHKL